MAQFDVHLNTGATRAGTPIILVVQSARFDRSARRVVVPLVDADAFRGADGDVNPRLQVMGRAVVLDPLQVVAMPRDRLGPLVGNLAEAGDVVIRALDQLITRAHG
jgi:toxin CcdB